MTFSTRLQISGNPEFDVNVKTAPFACEIGGEASLAVSTKPINGHVEQIPIRVRVPFLKHDRGYVVAASIGPFGIHLREIDATIRAFGIDIGGVIGKDGIDCDLSGAVRCCMEIDVNGKLPAKAVQASLKAMIEE